MRSRIELQSPAARFEAEFVGAVRRSRSLHRHFAQPPRTRAAFREFLRRTRRPSHEGHFLIERSTGALVGVVNVMEIVRGSFQSAYLGYYAFLPYAGRGYLLEGVSHTITRAFGELSLHRLEANIQPDNARSIALVKRLGFRREGFSPRYQKLAGRWRDHERWAITREEWRAGRVPA
jgi:ribosomal-protein-alanine N-acetyltransferase